MFWLVKSQCLLVKSCLIPIYFLMVQFLFSISMFIFWRTIRAPKKTTGLSKPRPRWAAPRHGMGFVLSNDVAKFIAEMSKKLPLRQATAWRKQWTRDLETFETIFRYLGGRTSSVNWIYPHFTEKPFETPPQTIPMRWCRIPSPAVHLELDLDGSV